MRRKLITLVLLIVSAVALYVNYGVTKAYYDSNYYRVEIMSDENELVLTENAIATKINIVLKNKSRKIISSDNNIFLSYHLYDLDGREIVYDNARTQIKKVNPFAVSEVIPLIVERPVERGVYMVKVDMVEEYVAWFAEKGNPTLDLKLTVQ